MDHPVTVTNAAENPTTVVTKSTTPASTTTAATTTTSIPSQTSEANSEASICSKTEKTSSTTTTTVNSIDIKPAIPQNSDSLDNNSAPQVGVTLTTNTNMLSSSTSSSNNNTTTNTITTANSGSCSTMPVLAVSQRKPHQAPTSYSITTTSISTLNATSTTSTTPANTTTVTTTSSDTPTQNPTNTVTSTASSPQISQSSAQPIKIPNRVPTTTTKSQPLALATTTTPASTGPTALVIIPQHCNMAGPLGSKTLAGSGLAGGKNAPISSTVGQSHLSIPINTQAKPVQLMTSVMTTTSASTVPISAHQLSSTPTTITQQQGGSTITGPLNMKPTINAGTIPGNKTTPTTTSIGLCQPHLTIPVNSQAKPVQLTAQVMTTTPTIVPISAHQQSSTPTAMMQQGLPTTTVLTPSRPSSTAPVASITSTPTITPLKTEFVKPCCLIDNGVKCDRVAGNASFNARIQKIVASKKMNFVLDSTARHTYICDEHKGIINVAKKSATMARENNKASAREYRQNNINNKNTANNVNSQLNSNFNNEMAGRTTVQHPMNIEMIGNQNMLINNHNHPSIMNNQVLIRPGPNQMVYAHYQAAPVHPNQIAPMEVMMSSGFDMTGGDSMTPRAGSGVSGLGASSGGVDVDLQQLQVNTLRRYKRHFRVPTRPGLNKMQLAESLKSHFRSLPIIEKEAITYFVYIVKCYRNKLDHNPKAD